MTTRWLNLYFRYSGYTFNLKQKIVRADNWVTVVPYALLLIVSELGFTIISFPVYLLVSPEKVQEEGYILPRKAKDKSQFKSYAMRRKVTLATFLGAGGIFLLKVFVVGFFSYLLFGVQQLLADSQDWNFDTSSDYVYNSAKVEVAGGLARLKDIGTSSVVSTTNPSFVTSSVGWTYADWLNNSKVSGVYVSSGGSSGGYVNISISDIKNKTTAGYWRQSFTVPAGSPDSATLSFDWKSISITTSTLPVTYQLYAYIDTGIGVPASTSSANYIWHSGEITNITSWTSSTVVDIKNKLPSAGTYTVKLAAYVISPSVTATYTYVSGFDNIVVNWSKVSHVYASDKPTTTPITSLTVPKAISWDSFSEVASGTIYYQLSPDNGTTWWYYNSSTWVTTTLATNYNSASQITANISKFTTSTNQIKWRAYLSGDGTQQVSLDNVSIGYTQNQRPAVSALVPTQGTTTGLVYISYNLVDTESDPSSLTAYEYSLNGTFNDAVTMAPSTTDPRHNGVTGLSTAPSGVGHIFVWDAKSQLGNVYNSSVYVRLRPNDGIGNGNYTTSMAIAIDYVSSTVSNVSAMQNAGTTTVAVTYDVFDNTSDNITVEMQVSGDGGSTWTVPATSLTGDIGAGVAVGNGKNIIWLAGNDYPNQQKSTLQVRLRAKDKFQNQGTYTSSTNFSLDTLPPATLVTANLKAQPNAGDTTVLIGGSFTESNPNANDFYVAIDGGDYGSATGGDANTATPANNNTNISATLDGNDYISKVKIVHTDDYGLAFANENLTPSSTIKYVKPYTPQAPTLNNPVTTRLDLQINPHASEANDLEYAIFEATTSKYVQSDGTLGNNPVWQAMGTASNQWGDGLNVSGKVRVTGLVSPVANYIFKVKSRNPSDSGHTSASESAYSATAQITNSAPAITLNSYSQTADGTRYVPIVYTGTDAQGDISSLSTYEYSLNGGATWSTITEKAGVGSNGTTNLTFLPTGSAYNIAWNSGADAPNIETSTAKIRLKGNDTLVSGSLITSNNFTIDNKAPAVSGVVAEQTLGTRTIVISYALTDANSSEVLVDISSDGGTTWTVATSTLAGAVGDNVTPGNKSITWNAATDFNSQYNTTMQLRFRISDSYGNQGTNVYSAYFTVDTHAPALSNLTATQDPGADSFVFHYDVSEDVGNSAVLLAISSDSGSTWTIATSTATGDKGSGIANGLGKTITWNAGTDYDNEEKSTMQFRLTASDGYNNYRVLASTDFSLDSEAPRITNVSASQPLGGTSVAISYDLLDLSATTIYLDISSNNGLSWVVATSTLGGALGAGQTAGTGKTITWNAGTDFPNQNLAFMKVRVRGTDVFNNSNSANSAIFDLDTLPPAILATAELKSQPNAGDATVLIGGTFTETNPSANNFYVAINGMAYGSATVGEIDTASPNDRATAIGATLKGNDYISKIKVTHTDKYNQSVVNENVSPNVTYKYVRPYIPAPPSVINVITGAVTVVINKNPAEADGLEYAIYDVTQGAYVQSNGTLGASPVWQVIGTGSATQWGYYLSVAGQVRVTGLTSPASLHQFQIKSRNPSDVAHAVTSESAFSSSASAGNQSPIITINNVSQSTDGSKYVTINYAGVDLENNTSTLVTYDYSTDNVTWHTMTEKSGVGSDGKVGLIFTDGGTAHDFMWDVGADLPNTEDDTVYIRLKANDGTDNGGLAASSAFMVDTLVPVVSAVTASQNLGSNLVTIDYDLVGLSNVNIALNISNDSGVTWAIATSTATGDVGANISTDLGKVITWNPGIDYPGQEASTMRVKINALDNFGNQGALIASANFAIDTKAPVFANVTASQIVSSSIVRITYDISDANSSNVALDISSDGGLSWDVTDVSVVGDIGSGVVSGSGKSFTWDAGADFPNHQISNMRVRLRAVDAYDNTTGDVFSNLFAINTQAPDISAVVASQILGSNNVSITYNLFDSDNVAISLDISADGGNTWTIATSSATGAVGAVITPGLAKLISWNAEVNYNNQQNTNMKVRLRGTNAYGNTGYSSVLLGAFSIDSLAPVVASPADLQAQPNAGDISALIGGSFNEENPDSNNFLVAINGGDYFATTTGQNNTASPADKATVIGATLTGVDYISKVKIVETDDYGHIGNNENVAPNSNYKFVKPYTPLAPTVNNPQNTSVDLTINPNVSESTGVEYAIYEVSTGKYVQTNGSLGASEVWKTLGTGVGQWGNISGIAGKINVGGLTSPVSTYSFKIKSRNPSDVSHAVSSQSDYSLVASITNSAPAISITSANQSLDGGYVTINYIGTDTQNDTNDLLVYEYSINNINWQTMTEKASVGSSGTSSLAFSVAGSAHNFVWDATTDLPNQEQTVVYIRLRSTDGLASSNLVASSAFSVDTKGPVVSNFIISQAPNSSSLTFGYDLVDSAGSNNVIALEISADNGATYDVPTTTLSGDVGSGITAGVSRSVTWNAGVDFVNQENSSMKIRIRGTDRYGNMGNYDISGDFGVDTKGPIISGVSASQSLGSSNVEVNYTLTDNTPGGHLVEFAVSSNSGATWLVSTTTHSGSIGSGQTTGIKRFTWLAGTDFSGQDLAAMRVQVRARDYFGNQGVFVASANFSLDTLAPVISGISASQTVATSSVAISYDLNELAIATLDISSDGGATWSVAKTTLTGALGLVTAGLNKSIAWNAGTDFSNQENSTMRVRLQGVDSFGNTSDYYESTNFSVDTVAPLGLTELSKFSNTTNTVTVTWQANSDAHFNHFELWHGANLTDVNNHNNTAQQWSVAADANLINPLTISTVITGLSLTDDYYVKIWAVDDFGNVYTVPAINVYEAPIPTPEPAPAPVVVTGGSIAVVTDNVAPGRPILNPLTSPTRTATVKIAGLAEPRSMIDLYDNGLLVARLNSLADANGIFEQNFNLANGNHLLTVKAIDGAGNSSQLSNLVILNITTTTPTAPIILTPQNNGVITDATPQIIGVAEADSQITLTIDNNRFIVKADGTGAWSFIVPSTLALANGRHTITTRASDGAGNQSNATTLVVNKITAIAPISTTGSEVVSLPAVALINSAMGATELAGIPVPAVTTAGANLTASGDILSFSGTSLPNTDVVVYIHSDQALVYQARTDASGNWKINHSQTIAELAPGQHTIYAVALDTGANVKSRPSPVNSFMVKRNLWVMIYNYLNWQTTVAALIVLLLAIFWLYRVRKPANNMIGNKKII